MATQSPANCSKSRARDDDGDRSLRSLRDDGAVGRTVGLRPGTRNGRPLPELLKTSVSSYSPFTACRECMPSGSSSMATSGLEQRGTRPFRQRPRATRPAPDRWSAARQDLGGGPARPWDSDVMPVDGLLGRESEVAFLTQLLDGAPRQGVAMLVSGEPGIGKSALLDEVCRRASERDMRVLRRSGTSRRRRCLSRG